MARRARRRSSGCATVGLAIAGIGLVVVVLVAVAVVNVISQRTIEASLQRPEVDDRSVFITAIAPLARESMEQTGVPASVTMGQAILESGWGSSGLSNWSGNYFGIKCGDTRSELQADCVARESQEYYDPEEPVSEVSDFRAYHTARDSFRDHGEFLRNTSRYAGAFEHTDDPDEFIRAVREAGYATDPNYSEMVISLMQDYDLYRYDDGEPAGTPVQGDFAGPYRDTGGVNGPLGVPMGPIQSGPVDGTRMIIFDQGVIVESEDEFFTLTGSIWQAYRADAEVRSRLGVPERVEGTEDEQVVTFDGGTLTAVADGPAQVDYN